MKIGIIEDSPKLAEILQRGLEMSGNTITIYERAQEATTALLNARFNSETLPIEILVADESQVNRNEIVKIRQFIGSTELPIIVIGKERNVLSEDIRILSKPFTVSGLLAEIANT